MGGGHSWPHLRAISVRKFREGSGTGIYLDTQQLCLISSKSETLVLWAPRHSFHKLGKNNPWVSTVAVVCSDQPYQVPAAWQPLAEKSTREAHGLRLSGQLCPQLCPRQLCHMGHPESPCASVSSHTKQGPWNMVGMKWLNGSLGAIQSTNDSSVSWFH